MNKAALDDRMMRLLRSVVRVELAFTQGRWTRPETAAMIASNYTALNTIMQNFQNSD